MPDREKIKAELDAIVDECRGCDYVRFEVVVEHCTNILYMLKEQKAKTVESIQMDRSDKWGADLSGYCPSCKRPLKSRYNQRFCGECGQELKWDG